MKHIILLMMIFTSPLAQANAYNNQGQGEAQSLISIDGQFNQRVRKLTPTEKLKRLRKKLEKKHELMVKRRIEIIRYQQEVKMMKKTEKAMNQMMNRLNSNI